MDLHNLYQAMSCLIIDDCLWETYERQSLTNPIMAAHVRSLHYILWLTDVLSSRKWQELTLIQQ